ncbi:MAG: hypothetical protein LBU27_00050 [Candidatus Peribacteria bacterium]|nr:hypothetical protein [Candidatus Peribacteria bacterium]
MVAIEVGDVCDKVGTIGASDSDGREGGRAIVAKISLGVMPPLPVLDSVGAFAVGTVHFH